MRRSPRELNPLNQRSTAATGLIGAIVHPSLTAIVAIDALHVPEVAKSRATRVNAVLQDLHDRASQPFDLLRD